MMTPMRNCYANEFEIAPAIKKAYLYEKQGRLAEACVEYEKACNSMPKYYEPWFLAGRAYFNQRQFRQARTHLETARSLRPDDIRCLQLLGETLLALRKPTEARAVLQDAIRLNSNVSGLYAKLLAAIKAEEGPEGVKKALKAYISRAGDERNASMLAGCGSYYLTERNTPAASHCFQKALEIDSKLGSAYMGMAEVFNQRGRYQDAVSAMESGIKYSGDKCHDYIKLALLHANNREPDRALLNFNKAIELDKDKEPMILSLEAYALLAASRHREALAMAKRALASGSETCETYLCCAQALYQMKRITEARPYLDLALSAAKTAVDYRKCGQQLVKFNDLSRALAFLDRAIKLDPGDGAAYTKRGEIFASQHQQMKALADFSKAIELNKRDAEVRRARAQLYTKMRRNEEARSDMTVALALERNPNEILRLAIAEKEAGRFDSADTILQKAAEIASDDISFRRKKARLHEDMKQFNRAIEDYTVCINLCPSDATLYMRRGDVYGRIGKETEKLIDMTEVLRLEPSAKKFEARARFYLQLGRAHNSIDDCTTALSLPDVDRRSVLYVRACAYKELNDFKSAIADCTEGIKAKPDDAAHYGLRGGIYAKTNQLDLALRDMDSATRLAKKNPEMWYSRGKIYSKMKQYEKAATDFETALKLENHPRYEHALQEARNKAD